MLLPLLLIACSGDAEPADGLAPQTQTTDSAPPTRTTDSTPPTGSDTPLSFAELRPKNLLMISIDTMRKDHLTRYGGPGITDWMDARMAEGVVMDDHQQCSAWTFPGTSCTLLGRHHEENGHIPQLSVSGRAPFPDGLPFLAVNLSNAGFHTVITSPNSWLSSEWNATQGYANELPKMRGADLQMTQGFDALMAPDGPVDQGQPWFLHVHLTEPHVPYDPPAAYLGGLEGLDPIDYDLTVKDDHYVARDEWAGLDPDDQELVLQHMRVRYEAEIAWMDDKLEAAFATFDAAGLLDDTLVVVWNDHGEQFWEHGHLSHAYDLYRQENDGFLFFWAEGLAPTVWDGPTSAVDVVPTLLEVFAVDDTDWRSGQAIGTAPRDRVRYGMVVARAGLQVSVTRGDDRLLFKGRTGTRERFDLAADPGETSNLYGTDAALDAELWALARDRAEMVLAVDPDIAVVWPDDP